MKYIPSISGMLPRITRDITCTWWTPEAFFQYDTALVSAYYGIDWGGSFREKYKLPKDFILVADSVTGDSQLLYKDKENKIHSTTIEKFEKIWNNTHEIKILSMNKDNRLVFIKPSNFIKHKVQKKIYEIQTIGGRYIKITEDHSLFTLDDNYNIVKIKGNMLKKNDFIICPSKYRINNLENKEYSDDLITFLGLWVADGNYTFGNNKKINGMSISSGDDKECLDLIDRLSKEFKFNYKKKNKFDVGIYSTKLGTLMYQKLKFQGNSHTKKIPDFIFNISKRQMGLFLKGYFSGDGSITGNIVKWGTVSKELSDDIHSILLILRIKFNCYKTKISYYDSKPSDYYYSYIQSNKYLRMFSEKIGFLQKWKNEKINIINIRKQSWVDGIPVKKILLKNQETKFRVGQYYSKGKFTTRTINRNKLNGIKKYEKLIYNDILFLRIKTIKEIKHEGIYVYDFSVPKYENFVVSNIVAHNSGGFQNMTLGNILNPLKVLQWQEEYADIGFSFDLPILKDDLPEVKKDKQIKTVQNAYDMLNAKKTDMKLYAVFQGHTQEEQKFILDEYLRKGDINKFDGFAIGGLVPISSNMALVTKVLASFISMIKKYNKPIHFFGLSGLNAVPILYYLTNRFGIEATYDSSSFAISNFTRGLPLDYGRFNKIVFKRNEDNGLKKIPCTCPVCSKIDIDKLKGFRNETYMMMHCLWQQLEYNRVLDALITSEKLFKKYTLHYNPLLKEYYDYIDKVYKHGVDAMDDMLVNTPNENGKHQSLTTWQ